MVTYIRSDLEFILDQIKLAEAHAAATPLFGPGGLVSTYNLSSGLRTVDGSYNHLLPGQEQRGAADRQFPELLDPVYRPADGTVFDEGDDDDDDDDAPAPSTSWPVVGTPQDDLLLGNSGGDLVFGFAGTDHIVTGAGPDVARAGAGNDFVAGEAGRDVLFGEDGDDDPFGGNGDDRLFGENGNDLLDAGDGDDTIRGFEAGDKIESGIDANTGTVGNDTPTLEGGQTTTAPGQIGVTHETREDGEYTAVSGDTSGNNAPEFCINIAGNHALTTDDFISSLQLHPADVPPAGLFGHPTRGQNHDIDGKGNSGTSRRRAAAQGIQGCSGIRLLDIRHHQRTGAYRLLLHAADL